MTLVLSLVAFLPAPARAEPVFFDDFDGDDLLPHWSRPPDDYWEYNVSGGMLNVTDLLYPSNPKSPANWVLIEASFAPQTDFRADIWMGWEAGDPPQELALYILGSQGQIIAQFGYYEDSWRGQVIGAGASNQAVFEPAPPPGMYQFTITRIGTAFEFYFNGEPFASISDRFGTPAAGLDLWFLGPYPGQFGAFHVDRVRVTPTPGALSLVAGIGFCSTSRKRPRITCAR